MLRTIIFFLDAVFGLIGISVYIKKTRNLIKEENNKKTNQFAYKIASTWSQKRLAKSKANVVVHGLENLPKEGPILFVGNHISNFDFLIILAKIPLPLGFIAKVELQKIPLLRTWMEFINCLFINREDMKQQLGVILEGIDILKKGGNLVVFPEGTRSKTGEMAEFKAGSFKLATKSKATIVPLTFVGTANLLENNNNILKPCTVEFYVHPPIKTSELSKEELSKIHETVQEIVKSPFEKE